MPYLILYMCHNVCSCQVIVGTITRACYCQFTCKVTNNKQSHTCTASPFRNVQAFNMEEERTIKDISMAQWRYLNRKDGFVNLPWLPLSCEISRTILLPLVGLTSGCESVRLWGCETKYRWITRFLKFCTDRSIWFIVAFNNCTALLQQYQCI